MTTQSSLPISNFYNSIIFTKDGRMTKVLEVKPVNFALKSEEDKNGLIGQFQNFLNSLSFPVQIVVQSRKIDIAPYLTMLKEKLNATTNQLMQIQLSEYMNFIGKLTELANIMDKKFYVAVSYSTPQGETGNFFSRLFGGGKSPQVKMSRDNYEKNLKLLDERVNTTIQGLLTMELPATVLTTQQLIEIFYGIYNPEESLEQHLAETSNIQAQVIQSEAKKAPAEQNRLTRQ